jgi:glucose dehydrogenase
MGNSVYAGTLDAALIALDRTTGLLLWEIQVADTMLGYSITQSPLVVDDLPTALSVDVQPLIGRDHQRAIAARCQRAPKDAGCNS